jgi:serine/threonine protein kinase
MPVSAGDKLGPYEILAPIGAGGMGEVWKARDSRLGRMVAIKLLKSQHTARFEQEARAIAALNHPHICQITTSVRITWSWNMWRAGRFADRCQWKRPCCWPAKSPGRSKKRTPKGFCIAT